MDFKVIIGLSLVSALICFGIWTHSEINILNSLYKACKGDISYFSERQSEDKAALMDEIRHLQKQLNDIRAQIDAR